MVERAGLEDDAPRREAPGEIDDVGEEVPAEPAPDIFRRETEELDFGDALGPRVDFGEARGRAVHVENVEMDGGIGEDARDLRVRNALAAHPFPGLADDRVDVAVEMHRRALGAQEGDLPGRPRNRPVEGPRGLFEIGDDDLDALAHAVPPETGNSAGSFMSRPHSANAPS